MKIRCVNLYGLLVPYFENYVDNFKFVIFNANFGTIKKSSKLLNTCHLLFQNQFLETLKQFISFECCKQDSPFTKNFYNIMHKLGVIMGLRKEMFIKHLSHAPILQVYCIHNDSWLVILHITHTSNFKLKAKCTKF